MNWNSKRPPCCATDRRAGPFRPGREAGVALPLVVLALFVVSVLALGVMELARAEGALAVRSRQRLQALNLAEAGLERAKWRFRQNPNWDGDTFQLGNGTVTVAVTSLSGDWVLVASTAEVGNQGKTINREMEVKVVGPAWPPALWDYAIVMGVPETSPDMAFRNHAIVQGNVFAYGSVDVRNQVTIEDGTIWGTHGIYGRGTYTVGDEPDEYPPLIDVNVAYYEGEIAAAGEAEPGDLLIEGETYDLNGGTLYVNGNVEVRTHIAGPGRIVASGDIKFGQGETAGGVDLIAGNELRLHQGCEITGQTGNVFYASNDMTLDQGVTVYGMTAFLAPEELTIRVSAEVEGVVWAGRLFLHNWAVVRGAIHAWSLWNDAISNHSRIIHDRDKLNFQPPPGVPRGDITQITLGTWSED